MLLALTQRERNMLAAVLCLLLLGLLGMIVLRSPQPAQGESGFSGRASDPPAQSAP